jgi:hypothetical protein
MVCGGGPTRWSTVGTDVRPKWRKGPGHYLGRAFWHREYWVLGMAEGYTWPEWKNGVCGVHVSPPGFLWGVQLESHCAPNNDGPFPCPTASCAIHWAGLFSVPQRHQPCSWLQPLHGKSSACHTTTHSCGSFPSFRSQCKHQCLQGPLPTHAAAQNTILSHYTQVLSFLMGTMLDLSLTVSSVRGSWIRAHVCFIHLNLG